MRIQPRAAVAPFLLAPLIALAVPAQTNPLDYPSIWQCGAGDGVDNNAYAPRFNWYCDLTKPAPEQAEAPPPASDPQPAPSERIEIPDIKTAEQMRKELARRLDVATMEPTPDHIRDYIQLWQMTQEKGAVFADNWRRVVWQDPALDYTLTRPANNSAIKVYDAKRDADEESQLRALARDHGLIFFFRSDCPYCHAMAPVMRVLADKYGIDVLGVTVDGRGIDEFPHPADGRSKAAAWGVERVPALFIGSKQTGDHAPIGFGAMSLSEIVNRIFVLTGTKAGDNF
ncbi:conjugal transfer protein TraF [Burkholderia stagnalis]|uniref:conjugal transfer protein TraF n=1 Tax=Burkholderia stagnalis TaxID=1503054 RepID=UPI000754AE9F|nr:conjugal transfer protein TraF [Burkholderia stagnalis]KVL85348.1 conjugal transfer protein TraF [Burkholderia stagnalis]KVL91995.1 conjugal transfer protein TraF [Burkholderia stagnalis]KVM06134.1 conjugal transfer protein TraF [Burkholderia stagnalis]